MPRKIVSEFDAITGPFHAKMTRIDASITRFERGTLSSFGRVEKGVDGIMRSASRLRLATSMFATGFGLNFAARFVDQSKRIRNALREAGDSSEETFQKVFNASVRSLAGFGEFTTGVQRFQKSLGETQDISASIRQMETLSKLLALGGKTQTERASTMLQFSQALQAGVLGGEELRAIRENAPIELTRAIARAAGGTIKDLKALAREGKLTTEVMVEALETLEVQADRRFANIQVTIQDAAKVFASGAIIAAEGFDKGLGLSGASVSALKGLGEILGQDAGAAEVFGKAMKLAGISLGVAFAGRRMTGYHASLKTLSKARLSDVAAATKQIVTSKARIAQLDKDALALQRKITKELLLTGSVTKRAAAEKKLGKISTARTAEENRATAATTRLAAAQRRLAFTSRAAAAAGSMLRGAWAFLGGWPGLALAAGTAFYMLKKSISDVLETAGQSLDRIDELPGKYAAAAKDLATDTEKLKELNDDLTEAIEAQGSAAVTVAAVERQALLERIAGNKALLQTYALLAAAEMQSAEAGLQKAKEAFARKFGGAVANSGAPRADVFDGPPEKHTLRRAALDKLHLDAAADRLKRRQGQVEEKIRLNLKLTNADLEFLKSQEQIAILEIRLGKMRQENQSLFEVQVPDASAADAHIAAYTAMIAKAKEAEAAITGFIDKNKTAEEKRAAAIKAVTAARADLIAAYGAEHPLVAQLDATLKRLNSSMRSGRKDTDDLTIAAIALRNALAGISSVELGIEDRLSVIRAKLNALGTGAGESTVQATGFAQGEVNKMLGAGVTDVDQIANSYEALLAKKREELDLEKRLSTLMSERFGKAGGGAASEADDLKEALAYIDSMMSAEETRAAELAKILALRQRLAKTYPNEVELLGNLDSAIARASAEFDDLNRASQEFWNSLSDNIAASITDWNGWGNFVRSLLADIVQEHGADFLQALFSPGTSGTTSSGSTGSSLGATIAGWITSGLFHGGGIAGSPRQTRTVPLAAFAGAARYHSGGIAGGSPFKAGEVPAILERGEVILPKNLSTGAAGSTSVTFVNDFRGAESSAVPQLAARIDKMAADFDPQVIKAVLTARNKGVRI